MRALTQSTFLANREIRHALILGGGGYLGVDLVRRLTSSMVRTTCVLHETPVHSLPRSTRIVRGSLGRFPWDTLERDPPDVLFHLDTRGSSRGAFTHLRNRIANERLLRALAALEHPPLLLFVWGGGVAYGSRGEEIVTEDCPLARSSSSFDYYRAELLWRQAQQHNDLPVIVIRTAWVLSPASLLVTFYKRFIGAEGAVPVVGNGNNWMSFVHVDDCAGLILHAARRSLPGSAVNVFSGVAYRQADFARKLAELRQLPIRSLTADEVEQRFGRVVRQAFECSAHMGTLHTALRTGFEPRHDDPVADVSWLVSD